MILINVLILVFFSFVLIKSADHVVVALRRIARHSKVGLYAISAIILALGTSFPELSVSLTSALEGSSEISLGVILGSNIANIALIGSLACLISGRVLIHDGEYLHKDYWLAVGAGVLPVILAFDRSLNRVDGLILLSVYAAYASSLFKIRFFEIAQREIKAEKFFHRFFREIEHVESLITKEYGRFFIALAVMLFSADALVKSGKNLAENLNIPVFLIALVVISIGTSFPELAFSLRSLKDHEPRMFFGNLLGSTIVNSTLIVGVATVINPVENIPLNKYYISGVFFLLVYLIFYKFIRSKFRFERKEALILILIYILFVVVEFL